MERPWVVILAGGEGSRVRSMTLAPDGVSVPKQFCRLREGTSLFRHALARGLAITSGARVVPVVCAQHRSFWERDLVGVNPPVVIEQQESRGTAQAVYLALLEIGRRDPRGTVLIIPSDHMIDDEVRFQDAAARLCREAEIWSDHMILLGVATDSPDPEYGWIVPSRTEIAGTRSVWAFVEKPTTRQMDELFARGALINALVVAAKASTLLVLYSLCLHDLVGAAWPRPAAPDPWDPERMSWDFSHDFLAHTTSWQRVLEIPACGWCDLGTPNRLRRWLDEHEQSFTWASAPEGTAARHPASVE